MSSDQSAIIVNRTAAEWRKAPFKYFNFWKSIHSYHSVIEEAWALDTQGTAWFRLYEKFKDVKTRLQELNRGEVSDISKKAEEAREVSKEIQRRVLCGETVLSEEAGRAQVKYRRLATMEEQFLKQKSRVKWLKKGDSNSALFYRQLKSRTDCSSITSVVDCKGYTISDIVGVKRIIISYFEDLFKTRGRSTQLDVGFMRENLNNVGISTGELLPYREEIKNVVMAMPLNKAPGPDGYSIDFFRNDWKTVEENFVEAIDEFFKKGRFMRRVNHTIITLVPKMENPTKVSDYRPISGCNAAYKCVAKILANRLRKDLPNLIGQEQSAFVPGRSISNNVLLAHELVQGYNNKRDPPRCFIKVDIAKAYDTIE